MLNIAINMVPTCPGNRELSGSMKTWLLDRELYNIHLKPGNNQESYYSFRLYIYGALRKLCVHRALNEYVRRSGNYRQDGTAQLFVAYGRRVKGKPISKQRLSNWLVKCIKFAYEKHVLPVPDRVKGHQTHKMAVTYADMAGADPQTICEVATWRNSNMFARFYWLDAVANSDAVWQESSNAGWLIHSLVERGNPTGAHLGDCARLPKSRVLLPSGRKYPGVGT